MFEPEPDYAPDLEWMLQSGQVPREILLEALVTEFYAPIFRLALSLLDDRSIARYAANTVFANALVDLHRYRPQDGFEIWLYQIALEVIQSSLAALQTRRAIKANLSFLFKADDFGESQPENVLDSEIWLGIDQLEHQLRFSLIAHMILDWQTDRLAKLFREPEEIIQARIEKGTQIILDRIVAQKLPEDFRPPDISDDISTLIRDSLQTRYPQQEVTPTELKRVISQNSRRASQIGKQKRGVITIVELTIIVLVILIGSGLAWGMDYIGSDLSTPSPTPPVSTMIVTKIVQKYVTATPVSGVPFPLDTNTRHILPRDLYAYVRGGERIEEAAARLDIPSPLLQQLNRVPDGVRMESGQRLLLPQRWQNLVISTNTPVPKISPNPPLNEPILSESILQRIAIQGPRYSTVWFDAQIVDHGPLSYIGPTRIFRSQHWESASQSLALVGDSDLFPEEVVLHQDQTGYLAKPEEDNPWFSDWRELGDELSPSISRLNRAKDYIFNTTDLERAAKYEIIGRELQAGIQSILLEVHDVQGNRRERIWYDDSRGFILRRIRYFPGQPDTPEFEVWVDNVAYDIEFPADLFDFRIPWRGGFALNSAGVPAPLKNNTIQIEVNRPRRTTVPAPPGFDPALSRLYFQYDSSPSPISMNTHVEIFTDEYFLGQGYFGDPWELICDRSDDGKMIAFVSKPVNASDSESILKWFAIKDPTGSFESLSSHLGVTEFAFAPNNHTIAYFSRSSRRGMGILGIFDTKTNEDRPLLMFGDVKSLVWHPDGDGLAMIARFDASSYDEYVAVIDPNSGKISYSAPIDIISNAGQDWPMLDWGVEFPVEMAGMDGCASPPSKRE